LNIQVCFYTAKKKKPTGKRTKWGTKGKN
jgi:hypothetical protein